MRPPQPALDASLPRPPQSTGSMSTDEATILTDDRHTRADLRMMMRAVRQGEYFGLPQGLRRRAVKKAAKLLNGNNRDIASGLKAIVQMAQVNIAREKATTPTTQNNTQVNVYMPANSRESDTPAIDTTATLPLVTADIDEPTTVEA